MSPKALAACVVIILLLLGSFLWTEFLSPHWLSYPEPGPSETEGVGHPLPSSPVESYKKPAPDRKGNLTSSELAWALRERLTMNIWADLAEGARGAAAYNERTKRYNELVGRFEYTESDMWEALSRVESDRGKIASDAVDEMMDACAPADRTARMIWKAQRFLRLRGLYLSSPTGRMDENTAYAVKMYQMQRRETQTGRVDQKLLEQLKQDYLREKRGVKIGF